MKQLYVVYIPGLGDHNSQKQRWVLRAWRLYGIRAEYYTVNWRDGRPLSPKFDGLIKRIDEIRQAGHPVSLVGVSAGASLALRAFAERQGEIQNVVLVCGKVHNAQTVEQRTYERNPAFRESMAKVVSFLDKIDTKSRRRIYSFRPMVDGIVPPADTIVTGGTNRVFPSIGHMVSIALAITLGAPVISYYLKRPVERG